MIMFKINMVRTQYYSQMLIVNVWNECLVATLMLATIKKCLTLVIVQLVQNITIIQKNSG